MFGYSPNDLNKIYQFKLNKKLLKHCKTAL